MEYSNQLKTSRRYGRMYDGVMQIWMYSGITKRHTHLAQGFKIIFLQHSIRRDAKRWEIGIDEGDGCYQSSYAAISVLSRQRQTVIVYDKHRETGLPRQHVAMDKWTYLERMYSRNDQVKPSS